VGEREQGDCLHFSIVRMLRACFKIEAGIGTLLLLA